MFIFICICIGVFAFVFAAVYCSVPFNEYPCHVVDIDVTNRRNVQIANEIEQYILDHGLREFEHQDAIVEQWRNDCMSKVRSSLLYEHRLYQYHQLNDGRMPFRFRLVRQHTRYQQCNYVRIPYTVTDVDSEFECSSDYLWWSVIVRCALSGLRPRRRSILLRIREV